jgi:hypothetical protein
MSHEISSIDRQQGTRQAWHGLTQILAKITLAECWLSSWDVEKRPMREPDGSESEYCRIVCTDNPSIKIGRPVHCETYGLIDNREFLKIVQDSIDLMSGSVIESVGSVCERSRILVSVTIPEIAELTAAGRKFVPYLNFLSSHDMSAPFLVNASTICTVCNNTFGMNLHDSENKEFRVRVPHTKNASKALERIPELIDAYCGTQRRFAAIMDSLATKEVALDQAERFFTGFLTVKDASEGRKLIASRPERSALELSTRRANQIDRLTDLFRSGAGNDGNDRSDLFSSVTDYYSHESAGGRNVWKQVESSEFGAGAVAKDRAFSILQSDSATQAMIDVGDLVLSAN